MADDLDLPTQALAEVKKEEDDDDLLLVDNENESDNEGGKYEDDGFIIDALSDEEEAPKKKKLSRLKKGKKNKKRPRGLDEADYELINDNLGISVTRPTKQQKRSEKKKSESPAAAATTTTTTTSTAGERVIPTGDLPGEEPEPDFRPTHHRREREEEISDRLPVPQAPRRHGGGPEEDVDDLTNPANLIDDDDEFHSDEDSWIVDDEDGEGGAGGKKKRKKFRGGITSEHFRTADEIYGYDEYMDAVDAAGNSDLFGTGEYEEGAKPLDKFEQYQKQGFEPAVLKEKFFTAEDEAIRETDIPERFQLAFPGRVVPNDSEIEEEGKWIAMKLDFMAAEGTESPQLVKVCNVLRLLLVDHLELPFIIHYRKEFYSPELTPAQLYAISDQDAKWYTTQKRKKVLKEKYQGDNLIDIEVEIDFANTEAELTDFYDYLTLTVGSQSSAGPSVVAGQKRAEKRDLYTTAKRSVPLKAFVQALHMDPKDVAENITSKWKTISPFTPVDTINNLAFNSLSVEFSTEDAVIGAGKYLLAKEIAYFPAIRKFARDNALTLGTISTTPTPVGKREIDVFHPYITIKQLQGKPISMIKEGTFALIEKATQEGMLTYTIDVGDILERADLEQRMFGASGYTDEFRQWNEARTEILATAIDQFLVPMTRDFLKNKLKTDADDFVALKAAEQLEKLLLAGPYKPPPAGDGNPELDHLPNRVMACCRGDRGVEFVQLSPEGELVDHISLSIGMQQDVDRRVFAEFLTKNKPTVIFVGVDGFAWKGLFSHVMNAVFTLKHDDPEALPSVCRVVPADTSVARIFEVSERAKKEFPTHNQATCRAISVGRRMVDPMIEISTMCNPRNELRFLALHPQQSIVDKAVLAKQLERAFVNVVNAVGVDINIVVPHTWMHPVMQFVCGLGPRKAQVFIKASQLRGGKWGDRAGMEEVLHKNVYRNAAAFIRIRLPEDDMDVYNAEVLDDTRIHPEDYNLARKIAKDAFPENERDIEKKKKKKRSIDYVRQLMENPQKLEQIDTAYFNRLLLEKGYNKGNTIEDIKNELNNPYADCRHPYSDLQPHEIFDLVTGEPLVIGQIVNVKVTGMGRNFVKAHLDCGIPATISIGNLHDNATSDSRPEEFVQVGRLLPARIITLDKQAWADGQGQSWSLNVSTAQRDLKTVPPGLMPHLYPDTYLVLTDADSSSYALMAQEDEEEKRKKREKAIAENGGKPIVKYQRTIAHPWFKNVSFADAEEALKDKGIGEMIIRPSTKGPNTLTVTWKMTPDLCVHTEIEESDKGPLEAIGKELRVNGQTFSSLNNVIVGYIDPMAMFASDMVSYRKYKNEKREAIETMLQDEKLRTPRAIPYAVGPSIDHPGRYTLYYIPGSKTVVREYISLTPQGYKFRGTGPFKNPDELFKWFKKHFKDPIPGRQNQQPQYAAYPGVGHHHHQPHGQPNYADLYHQASWA